MMFVTEAWQPLEPEARQDAMPSRTSDLKARHILVLIAAGIIPLSFVSLAFAESWATPVAGFGLGLILFGVATMLRRLQSNP